MEYAELHCHSYYSFHDGASSLEELMMRAKELGYRALAVTEHDNLCGAMCFANLTASLGMKGIIGAELTVRGSSPDTEIGSSPATFLPEEEPVFHLTLLAENRQGYANLSRLITAGHAAGERNCPALPPTLLKSHSEGLIALSGCTQGELARLIDAERFNEARDLVFTYMDWFGRDNYFIELQHNLVFGDGDRIRRLIVLAEETGAGLVATGNVHYHIRDRHRLQDCLVSIKNCRSLEETHRERRPNSEFYLRSIDEITELFRHCPEAIGNTVKIAERCCLDLTRDLSYQFPDYETPDGQTPEKYLEELCHDAAIRRFGSVTPEVKARLDEEFRLINRYRLAGFLLLYHEVIKLGREVMIDLGLSDPSLTVEENPPGRGRGSSVSLLVGYLIGLSHIDPLKYKLSLERFLPNDVMTNVPDIDLDFPRSIREELILRTHQKWGWEKAVLTGTIVTYKIRGVVRDLGKALGLPQVEVDRLAKQVDWGRARKLKEKMLKLPGFQNKVDAPGWRDLVTLAVELDGFPKYMGQHPGGMVISSSPLTDIVPVQRAATEGRYVCQWDKDSIDDAGFVKIDFLALGTLSQLQDAVEIIRERTGRRIDMSRIDFDDTAVYDMLCGGDTIGIFQVESSAQMQTIIRLKPRNLLDMAHEVGAVRPGVGVNGGVQDYLARRSGRKSLTYDHPLEKRALERTLGVVLFQDQVNQIAIDVAGFAPSEADRMRRTFSKRHNEELIKEYHRKFLEGAAARGVPEEAAETIFKKFNGHYMFPESHAFAFGVTAYQSAWLKYYHPLEFFVAIFNQQPMGFYNMETLKEDAKRHGVRVLNPDLNLSRSKCVIEYENPVEVENPVSIGTVIQTKRCLRCDRMGMDPPLQGDDMEMTGDDAEVVVGRRRFSDAVGGAFGKPVIRLGFLQVQGLGSSSAKAIEKAQKNGPFRSIADFLERTGVLEEVALNLVSAGAFDSLEPNRRKVKWEIGLRYRPVNSQIPLPLPVEQDLPELASPGDWERMKGEYSIMGVYPSGHVMAKLRPKFRSKIMCSKDVVGLPDGARVVTAGLVIRRQRPHGKVVFMTLEDEFGLISLMVFPQTFEKYEYQLKSPFIFITGRVTRREGTMNVVVTGVKTFDVMHKTPKSKNWQ